MISGNLVAGIVTTSGSTDTSVQGNFIGTDPTGMSARANGTAVNHFFGAATWRDFTRNLISGNTNAGIVLETDDRLSPSTDQIRIQRNRIGFNRTLTALLRNGGGGIWFPQGSITNVLIGGIASTEGNEITGTADALDLRQITNITIQGNTIARAVGRGIWLNNVSNATIGGSLAGQGNIIGGNGTDGIRADAGSSGVTINGNQIGAVTITGGTFENQGRGIFMENVTNITIGDGTAGGRNVIARNGDRAIMGAATNAGITINGNYVGTDATGNAALANGQAAGISQRDAIIFEIGNVSNIAVLNNVIGGYGTAMIKFNEATASGVTIQGNNLGVGANGTTQIVSGTNESLIAFGGSTRNYSNVIIGGLNPGEGNILANGGQNGITVNSAQAGIQLVGNTIRNNSGNGMLVVNTTRLAIIANRIFSNGLLGVDLAADGVTPNDPGDGDTGPNDMLNFPAITAINVTGASQVSYTFTLDVPAAAPGYRVEFFANSAADPSGFGEGERYLGNVDITPAGGAQSYTGTLTTLVPVSIGDIISATATRRTVGGAWDITSEFSAVATAAGTAQLAVATASDVFNPTAENPFATPGNDILLTTTVSNVGTGSTDANSIFAVISINTNLAFLNDVTPAFGGVVGFASGTPSVTFTPGTDLRFSNSATPPASLAQCAYSPSSGYDSQVRYVCLNPKGALPNGTPNGQFSVQLRARIN
ncbi:MAG: right-handed parallel beta-helix repeat-containing protein [Erythrobacter sp.]|nr:right-handed parallel beta-helix repeat-containing protein [Erythrobacter sp.]